MAVAYVAS